MSTTVSYKGSTIATVSNDTKTLLTEGKYLEDDLTLTDVSGGGAVLGTKNITANGTYEAEDDSLDGYSEVTVAVPNTYSAGDEGKVVNNGALVAQTSDTVTENDTYDTTLINSLTVNVSGGGVTLPRFINHVEYTFATNADSSSKQTVNIGTVTGRYILFMTAQVYPSPDGSLYTALSAVVNSMAGNKAVTSAILRPNGTIGSDNSMVTFDPSTGVVEMGGPYATFFAGQTFDIYLFSMV